MVEEKAVQIREMQMRVLAAEGGEKETRRHLADAQTLLAEAKSEIEQLKR